MLARLFQRYQFVLTNRRVRPHGRNARAASGRVHAGAAAMTYDFAILGGGAAGLSLALELVKSQLGNKSILIVEKDAKDSNDRTWCFWADQPTPYDVIARKVWPRLRFQSEWLRPDLGAEPAALPDAARPGFLQLWARARKACGHFRRGLADLAMDRITPACTWAASASRPNGPSTAASVRRTCSRTQGATTT